MSKILCYIYNIMSKSDHKKTKHIWYNMNIYNNTTAPIKAEYIETRSEPLLKNPADYKLSITRFTVPITSVPIFIFPGITYTAYSSTVTYAEGAFVSSASALFRSLSAGNLNHLPTSNPAYWQRLTQAGITVYPDNNYFSVTLKIGNDSYREYVKYYPNNNANNLYIESYQQFLDQVNLAFAGAFMQLKIAHPDVQSLYPPYITYNAESQLMKIFAPRTFDYTQDDVLIYMNSNLFQYFETFQNINNGYNNDNGLDNLIFMKYNGDNNFVNSVGPTLIAELYSVSYVYLLNDVVYYNNNYYLSLNNSNVGNQPDISPDEWSPLTPNYDNTAVTVYAGGTTYALGDVVLYHTRLYYSLEDGNIGNQPDNSEQWYSFSPLTNFESWRSTVSYDIGMIINYQGSLYVSLTGTNLGNIPSTDTTNWAAYSVFESFVMTEEYNVLFKWAFLRQIVFTTQNIPTRSDYLPNNALSSSATGTILNNSKSILTDFEPDLSTTKSYLHFNTPNPDWRWIDLVGNDPLFSPDIKVSWQGKDQKLYDLYLKPTDVLTVKFLFQKISSLDY